MSDDDSSASLGRAPDSNAALNEGVQLKELSSVDAVDASEKPAVEQDGVVLAVNALVDDASNVTEKKNDPEAAQPADPLLLTKIEQYAWIGYHWAEECYSTVSISVFIPLLLDSLAFNGGFNPNGGGPCVAANLTAGTTQQCAVYYGSGTLDTTSFSLYSVAISVAVQAFVFISVSSLADFSSYRKFLLMFFAYFGATFAILFISTGQASYMWAGIITIFSNVSFGAASIFHNAYLPLLVESHPDMQRFKGQPPSVEQFAAASVISNRISTLGYSLGYLGGVIVLGIAAGIVFVLQSTNPTLGLELGVMVSGIWWAAWTLYPAIHLKTRPGPPFPKDTFWFFLSWKRVFQSFKRAAKFPWTFAFLICYFMFDDGYNTIGSVAVLFGRTVLGMTNTQLIIIALVTPAAAGIGNFALLMFQKYTKVPTKWMLIFCIFMLALLMAYGMIGFAPGATFGLVSINEMYGCAFWYGFFLGAAQSFSRVSYAQLIPPGHESEFFGLYGIMDKGSSWIGTTVTAALTSTNGNVRYGMIFLFFLLLAPVPVLIALPMQKAHETARSAKY